MSEKAKWEKTINSKRLVMVISDWFQLVVGMEPDDGMYEHWVEDSMGEMFEYGRSPTIEEAKAKAEQIAIALAERILTSLREGR